MAECIGRISRTEAFSGDFVDVESVHSSHRRRCQISKPMVYKYVPPIIYTSRVFSDSFTQKQPRLGNYCKYGCRIPAVVLHAILS